MEKEDGISDASVQAFNKYDAALRFAAGMIDWGKEKIPDKFWFSAMVNYNLGFGPTVKELGVFEAGDPREAQILGEGLAKKYFKEDEDTKYRKWDDMRACVAIRPCPPPEYR